MKNIKTILFVVLLFFVINVSAETECDTKEFSRLKELAKKVEFDYDYQVVDGVADFSIHAVNLNEDLKVLIINNYYSGDYRQFSGDSEATLSGFTSGERVVVTIKGFVPNACSGVTVYTKTIKLPYYNIYYKDFECKGNEDFKYCKKLLTNNITEKEYYTQLEKYLQNKYEQKSSDDPSPISSNKDLFLIIGGAILIIGIISFLINLIVKRRKKNKL